MIDLSKKLTLAAALTLIAPAAAEEFTRTLDADADAEILIFNTAGEIEIEGWSNNQVMVDADMGRDVEEIYFVSDGDEVMIEVKVPNKSNHRSIDTDLVVKVPEGATIHVGGVSADITVVGVQGEQKLETVSGDIETDAFEADIDAESVSGDIDADGRGGSIRTGVTTVSGDITLNDFSGEINGEAVNGDIEIIGGSFEKVRVETVNGDISFQAGLHGDSRLRMETVNGAVDVELTSDLSARVDIETFNGGINNCFGPEPRRTSKYAPGRELKFTEGSGDGRVTIRTLNGRVTLCK